MGGLNGFSKILSTLNQLSLDSSVFIYYIEEHKTYLPAVTILFEQHINTGLLRGFVSSILLTEILTRPYKFGDIALASTYKKILLESPNIFITNVDNKIADKAAQLRSRYQIKTPDSLHLSTALEIGSDVFLCNDQSLQKIKELKVLVLNDFT